MYGRAATEAVDNLPLDETTTPAVEALAEDFVKTGFDMRRLIRLVAKSAPFRVSSRADFEITHEHEQAGAVFSTGSAAARAGRRISRPVFANQGG